MRWGKQDHGHAHLGKGKVVVHDQVGEEDQVDKGNNKGVSTEGALPLLDDLPAGVGGMEKCGWRGAGDISIATP